MTEAVELVARREPARRAVVQKHMEMETYHPEMCVKDYCFFCKALILVLQCDPPPMRLIKDVIGDEASSNHDSPARC
jgi:hypothetical protein